MKKQTDYIDVQSNRSLKNYSNNELFGRIIWSIIWCLFRFSPRITWGWRNLLLRLMGAKIGKGVRIFNTVKIMLPWKLIIEDNVTVGDHAILYALGTIHLHEGVTISQYAHLCAGTHNFRDKNFSLIRSKITINRGAWIAADAFIGPDVVIGSGTVIGARSVVMKSIEDQKIVIGNPAIILDDRLMED